jgi:hypothetical protein
MKHFAVVLQLESKHVVMWQGLADDANHAEGLAIAAQIEQIYQLVSIAEVQP